MSDATPVRPPDVSDQSPTPHVASPRVSEEDAEAVERIVRDRVRLARVHATGLLDTPPEADFDRFTRLAAKMVQAPTALVSLVDADRDFWKSSLGISEPYASAREIRLKPSFCQHAIAGNAPLVVRDALEDPTYAALPSVAELGVRAYLGVPLVTTDGIALGSLCVLDYAPRDWQPSDIEAMTDLAAAVMTEVDLRTVLGQFKQASAEAEASRSRLSATLNGMSDGYIALDEEWHVTALNKSALRIDGRDADDLIGRSHWDLWPNTVGTRVEEEYRRVMVDGVAAHFEHHYDSPARDLWHEIDAYRTRDGIACFYRDITTRRRAADALAESERRFRDTFERAAAGIAHVALDGRWLRINPRLTAITGYSLQELSRTTFQSVAHPDDVGIDAGECARLVRGEIPMYTIEKRFLRNGGEPIWVHLTVSLVRTERGDPDYLIAVVEDISERYMLLESAQQAQRAAESANHARSEFVAQMSHELRTPLNAIMGYAELIQIGVRGPVTDGQAEDLVRIQRAARSLTTIIGDILNFAKVESGRVGLDIDTVDAMDVIVAAGALIGPQAAARAIDLATEPTDELLEVRADRERLQQIVLNLLTNALKYNRAGGSIRVACEAHDGMVFMHFADTGPGIPTDKVESIFEPFVQLGRSTASPVNGVGLGLAISRTLARAMGGDITVTSKVGEGSVFTVSLPRAVPVESAALVPAEHGGA